MLLSLPQMPTQGTKGSVEEEAVCAPPTGRECTSKEAQGYEQSELTGSLVGGLGGCAAGMWRGSGLGLAEWVLDRSDMQPGVWTRAWQPFPPVLLSCLHV